MRLHYLQIAVILAMLLVGWSVTHVPNMRKAPESLKRMCSTIGTDPGNEARDLCAEFNAR